ncbi:amidohydrolase [Dyella jiangningensis]|uniref:Amidohydrolase n=1 Tax=Dyella jiangningensis TaxID=1379159 RepID=A0A328P2A3_9GAMM|nr:amidohydrolase [Dyella jiangningensis]RAO76119.1 amidohydrolase [Dyella jiangningensis]
MRLSLRCSSIALLALAALPLQATTLLVNAHIHTMDPSRPEATALAWKEDGRLLDVGDTADLQKRYPDATKVDAQGATVIPGLIDAHGHMLGLGMTHIQVDLVGASSKQEIVERLKAGVAKLPKGAWLIGRGWDQNRWAGKQFPTAADLDAAFPDRPVYLERIDGHAVWVNTAAMNHATKALDGDWQPQGGRIVREGKKATGVLVDGAVGLVADAIPPLSHEQTRDAYKAAFADAVAVGLTGVHDPGVSLDDFKVLQEMAAAGEIPLRLYEMADGNHAALDWLCTQGGHWADASGRLQMRTVKLYMDGALGSRGAALLTDYNDDHGNRGILVTSPDAYRSAVEKAYRCHVQVATHAIGDRGNRMVLDTYQSVLGDHADSDHRWRVEHAQILALDDIPRFAKLRLIASMQPTHATSDMPWAEQRLGAERLKGAYAWQRFIHEKVPLAFGSDFPVEHVNPMLGLYAAVTRQDLNGQPPGGWLPDQRVSRIQALAGFTRGAAYAAFMENEVGTLKTGMRADFVILDGDLMTVPPRQIADLKPLSTWVDGKAVYRADKANAAH